MPRYSSQFPDPVCIVTAKLDESSNAMTVGWASPVSFKPPVLMVSIAPQRHTHELLLQSSVFGVSILSEDQKELSTAAGTLSGRDVDKLSLPDFDTFDGSKLGLPLIAGARAWMECKTIEHHTIGDHTAFYGEVLSLMVDETKRPLVLFNGTYYGLGAERGIYP